MALELVAAIALALSVGGFIYLIRKFSRGRLPKSTIPVAAALALIGFAVWGDYSWASRTASALPDRLVVVDEVAQENVWRPWSFLFPVTERFVAADVGGAERNVDDPNAVRVNLYFMERRIPARQTTVVVDCGPGEIDGETNSVNERLRDAVCSAAPSPDGASGGANG